MSSEIHKRALSRREFLSRAGKAGLAAAGALGLGLGLHDAVGPSGSSQAAQIKLPDYSMPQTAGRLVVVRGMDRAKTLAAGLKALGGLEQFIKPGERVLIKVNAAFASPPAIGATTNPELLAALIAHCRQAKVAQVLVSDNPIQDPSACFQFSGLAQACAQSGAELILPREEYFKPYTLPGGRLIVNWPLLYEPLARADRVIGLAPVKDHHRSGASLSMKNWYGLLGGNRAVFHQDINRIIAELASMISPTLVILDGTQTMLTNGPTGGSLDDLKATGQIIISTDQVAADAYAATLLDKSPAQLPFIAQAQEAGAGRADIGEPIIVDAEG